jgi:hypothetical protein
VSCRKSERERERERSNQRECRGKERWHEREGESAVTKREVEKMVTELWNTVGGIEETF